MMTKTRFIGKFAIFVLCIGIADAQSNYTPPAGSWERRSADRVKLDPAKLKEAVDFAIANEARAPRDLELAHYQTFGREPFGEAVGQFKHRGPATGLIIRAGYIVAEWGDPDRVDMTFSVTKSFLSTTVGLAFDRKLIRSLQN
jgi:CubicO group peptidase (beta-lactamase class C family)